ncbi:hypothetical protein BCR35DRAFT_309851 [Leucosporidium creatinivorum]|uniref:F-box domain-containing protein n=1 Tax=Leucosporidium creatinivorum TaxID=106004 RepID=A0A1Y2DAY6_9BASI|nr:hypothetical protein BCR35DRAFT_309851 [Leucosporidium creatinivorum]
MVQPTLPPELISEILKVIPGSDRPFLPWSSLATCCLVSKDFLPLARAELWATVWWFTKPIRPRRPPVTTISEDTLADVLQDRQQRQFQALQGNPERFGTLVYDVTIHTNRHESDANVALIDLTRRLCPNITKLTAGSYDGDSAEAEETIARFGGSLSFLSYLAYAWGPSSSTMLHSLSALRHLDLRGIAPPAAAAAESIHLPSYRLHTLQIACECSRDAFQLITHSSTHSLSTVKIAAHHDAEGRSWDFSPFPALSSLVIRMDSRSPKSPQVDNYSLIMDAISSTRALRSLALGQKSFGFQPLRPRLQVKADFLLRLPPTIQTLFLYEVDLVDNQLVEALENPAMLPALQHIAVPHLVPIAEEGAGTPVRRYREMIGEARMAIEKACATRSVSVEWIASRGVGGRGP